MRTRFLFMSSLVALGLLAFACSGKRPPPKEPMVTETVSDAGSDADAEPAKPKPLFERLGGREGIEKIVDAWLKNMAANDVTKKRFAKLSKDKSEAMKKKMVDQLCKEAGGDCEYTGKSMKDAHKGMKITEAEWNAMVKALHAAIEESGVGQVEQDDVLALVSVMRDEIVEQKPAPKK